MPQQAYRARKNRGFTIIELMITVALLGIAMGVALPNLVQFLADHRVLSTANELQSLLQFARMKAVNERTSVFVCLDTSSWSVIEKNDCTNTGEVFRTLEISSQITVSGDNKPSKITYHYNGTLEGLSSSPQSLAIYGCHTHTKYYSVDLYNTGMTKVIKKDGQKSCSEPESA